MESTRGNTHSVTFFPPGNVFFGSMISTMHPLTTNTAAVLRETARGCPCPRAGYGSKRSHDQSVYGGSVPGEAQRTCRRIARTMARPRPIPS